MGKFLFIGDPHVKKNNIEESKKLMDFGIELAISHGATIILPGDQYNDFNLVHTEVLNFWTETFDKFKQSGVQCIALVGNHDMSPDYQTHAMVAHAHQVTVIDKPFILNGIGYLPYIHKHEDFYRSLSSLCAAGVKTVFCHAEFNGATFENGYYSPGGLDTGRIPKGVTIISGHIHKRQELAIDSKTKVLYPGTPRMLTRADIGETKGVTLFNPANSVVEFIPVPDTVCEPFHTFTVTNMDELSIVKFTDRTYIEIKGDKSFIDEASSLIGTKCKFRAIPSSKDVSTRHIKESDGIDIAFGKFVELYSQTHNIDQQKIMESLRKYIA